jgi:hypothetical protein
VIFKCTVSFWPGFPLINWVTLFYLTEKAEFLPVARRKKLHCIGNSALNLSEVWNSFSTWNAKQKEGCIRFFSIHNFIFKRHVFLENIKENICVEADGEFIKSEDRYKCDIALMLSWFLVADPALAKSFWCRHFGISDSILVESWLTFLNTGRVRTPKYGTWIMLLPIIISVLYNQFCTTAAVGSGIPSFFLPWTDASSSSGWSSCFNSWRPSHHCTTKTMTAVGQSYRGSCQELSEARRRCVLSLAQFVLSIYGVK